MSIMAVGFLTRLPLPQPRLRGTALVWLIALVSGCGSSPPTGAAAADASGDSGADRTSGPDGDAAPDLSGEHGAAPADGGSGGGYFGFLPSNLAIEQLRLSDAATLGDVVVDSAYGCEANPDLRCMTTPNFIADLTGYKLLLVRINDDPPLDVYVARSWTITARTTLPLPGRSVLVALQDIVVDGKIAVGHADMLEAGEGSPGDFSVGSGGGSFCGRGGAGAYSSAGRAPSYGTAELIPPRVGSGGGPEFGSHKFDAGGFVHLLAAHAVQISATGSVAALGGAGQDEGAGSSGGAILIEAVTVNVAGILAVNGGGGGAGQAFGEPGKLGSVRAKGASDTLGNMVGGSGGAGSFVDGDDAASISVTAGGGGAVGRIRINSMSAQANITGMLSPGLDTACATQGPLHPLP
jgi:hypothetical protein